jgi:voltage-gated potassium channel
MTPLKRKIYEIIFEADTFWGKTFDVALIISVILSVLAVMLESVEHLNQDYSRLFLITEWFFTILFTIELSLRLYCINKKSSYLFSFYGLIDVLSVIPMYLTWFFPGLQSLGVLRAFRILRVFRILKLNRYISAGNSLSMALVQSKAKIIVFLGFIITIVLIMGSIMYLIEGRENGFTSIPKSIYWAIVTVTTVGYGDIVPQTIIGKIISSLLMIVGYGIIAVPTGLVSAQIVQQNLEEKQRKKICHKCDKNTYNHEAVYCCHCGREFN